MPSVVCLSCNAKFKSKKDMTGKAVRCPRCDETFVVGGEAPLARNVPSEAAPAATKRPPRSSPKPKPSPRKRTVRGKKRQRREPARGIPAPLVKLGGLAVIAGLIWYGLSEMGYVDAPPSGAPGSSTPGSGAATAALDGSQPEPGLLASYFGDTASSLTDELVECANDLIQVLAAAQDETSSKAAVERMVEIANRLRDVQKRATKAPLVSKQEIDEIKNRSNAAVDRDALQAEIDRISAPNFVVPDLKYEVQGLVMLMRSVGSTINIGLQELPEPEKQLGKFGELQHNRALLHRRALQAVLAVNGRDGLSAAVDALNSIAAELTQLAEKKSSLDGYNPFVGSGDLQYQEFMMEYDSQMDRHAKELKGGGVDVSALTSAIIGISEADSRISFAKPKRSSSDAAGAAPLTDSRPRGPSFAGTRPGIDGQRPPFNRGGSGGRPPFNRGGRAAVPEAFPPDLPRRMRLLSPSKPTCLRNGPPEAKQESLSRRPS